MRAFIDTSALAKKYKEEPETNKFLEKLGTFNQIIVSPITYFELLCVIKKNIENLKQNESEYSRLKKEVDLDYDYFTEILMTDSFKKIAYEIRFKYHLKSLDLIQLSAAKISNAQIILTSDKHLYKIASKILKNVELV